MVERPTENVKGAGTAVNLIVPPSAAEAAIKAMKNSKGAGRDLLPAEVPKAGGSPLAILQNIIENRIGE